MESLNVFIDSKQGEKSLFEERVIKAAQRGNQVALTLPSGEEQMVNGVLGEVDLVEKNLYIAQP